METSLKLQMDVKNNAEELRRYLLDLENWEEAMKEKDAALLSGINNVTEDLPPPRNKIKRNSSEKQGSNKGLQNSEKKPKKINAYDYSAWDKYDADKACDEVDEESKEKFDDTSVNINEEQILQQSDKDEADKSSKSLQHLDEALFEKLSGNEFVMKGKWEDAIKCYTRAIELDPKNAIYYANRAHCFIKLKNFKHAEVDATSAIQLDKMYVKAYQRRAHARTALGQLREAVEDYKKITEIEPKNVSANLEISKLEEKLKDGKGVKQTKPVFNPKMLFKSVPKKDEDKKVFLKEPAKTSVFSMETSKEKKGEVAGEGVDQTPELTDTEKTHLEKEIYTDVRKDFNDVTEKQMEAIFGKVPEGFSIVKPIHIPPHLRSKKSLQRVPVKNVMSNSVTFDEFVSLCNSMPPGEVKESVVTENKSISADMYKPDLEKLELLVPETCVQFHNTWKLIKNSSSHCHKYLKKIEPKSLPKIFQHTLESDLFSELISNLAQIDDHHLVHSYLENLSRVRRFGSLVLFLSSEDKKNLVKCTKKLSTFISKDQLEELCKLYEVELKELQ